MRDALRRHIQHERFTNLRRYGRGHAETRFSRAVGSRSKRHGLLTAGEGCDRERLATGASQIAGDALVTTTAANSKVELRNPAGV
jgi:hypothetical protein